MEVIVKKNYEEMSKAAATLFAAEIMENPKTILGMATGSTPVGLYKELVKMYEAGDLDFSQVTTFNLDEYIGLAPEHDQSYHYFMNDNLFNHVNINKENVHVPDGVGFEAGEAGKAYEELMAKTSRMTSRWAHSRSTTASANSASRLSKPAQISCSSATSTRMRRTSTSASWTPSRTARSRWSVSTSRCAASSRQSCCTRSLER